MAKNKKRVDMLKKENSKVIYIDTKEAELMYELLIKTNDVFKNIIKKAGAGGLDFEEAKSIRDKFQTMMFKTSDVLKVISNKTDVEYNEPFMLAKIRNEIEQNRGQ